MSWGEIKHAVNGSLGTNALKTLDRIVKDESYNNIYFLADIISSANVNSKIYAYGTDKDVFSLDYNLAFIEGGVFTRIFIPLTVKKVADNAVSQTYYPKVPCTVYIPSSVKEIGANAFNHEKIFEAIIYEGLEKIGAQAFRKASGSTFYLPHTVKEIGANAFPAASTVYVAWEEGKVSGAPWGASKVIYNNKHPW